jgi:hypothetical protein
MRQLRLSLDMAAPVRPAPPCAAVNMHTEGSERPESVGRFCRGGRGGGF